MYLVSKVIDLAYNIGNIILAPIIRHFNKLTPTHAFYIYVKKNIYTTLNYNTANFFEPSRKIFAYFINDLISRLLIKNLSSIIPALYYTFTTKIDEISDEELLMFSKDIYGSYITKYNDYYSIDMSLFKNKDYYPETVYNCGSILYFTKTQLLSIDLITDETVHKINKGDKYWKVAKMWMSHNLLVYGVIGAHVKTHRSLLPVSFISGKLSPHNPLYLLLNPHIRHHVPTQFKFYVADKNNVINQNIKGLDRGDLFGNYSILSNPVGIKIQALFEISTNVDLHYQLSYASEHSLPVESVLDEIMISYQNVYKPYISKFVDLYYDLLRSDLEIQEWKCFCMQYCEEFPNKIETKSEWIELLTCCICKLSVFHAVQHILIYHRQNIINIIPFRMRSPIHSNLCDFSLDLSKYVWKIDLFQHYLFRETEGKSFQIDDLSDVTYGIFGLERHELKLRMDLVKLKTIFSNLLGTPFVVSQSIHI
jgi:hypothetical protein